jgi:hypothetical protein
MQVSDNINVWSSSDGISQIKDAWNINSYFRLYWSLYLGDQNGNLQTKLAFRSTIIFIIPPSVNLSRLSLPENDRSSILRKLYYMPIYVRISVLI